MALAHAHAIAAPPRVGCWRKDRPKEPVCCGKGLSRSSNCSRSTSCFELAWAKEQPACRACAAQAPCDGDIDVGKFAAYQSSMNFTVVGVVLFLPRGWQTRTVNIFDGLELGLLAR